VKFKICILEPLSTSYETRMAQITSPPPHTFRFLPFCPSLLFRSPSPTAPAFFHFFPFVDPLTRMPSKSGPWQLDKVKRRLRQEQVAREAAASERYKRQEQRAKVQQNTKPDEQKLSLQERNVGGQSLGCYLLSVCSCLPLVGVCSRLVRRSLASCEERK
jgi:hypothetical protein